MALALTKIIDLVDKKAKGNRGITGYFKISKNDYAYEFIESPGPNNINMP